MPKEGWVPVNRVHKVWIWALAGLTGNNASRYTSLQPLENTLIDFHRATLLAVLDDACYIRLTQIRRKANSDTTPISEAETNSRPGFRARHFLGQKAHSQEDHRPQDWGNDAPKSKLLVEVSRSSAPALVPLQV
ncbi:hypothetical protein AN958_09831 [Leucoagaricus sp. SymC.cos]|nr:hypothetical protein AN958_09831 [Leucoagaricus sp. SymC.cos]